MMMVNGLANVTAASTIKQLETTKSEQIVKSNDNNKMSSTTTASSSIPPVMSISCCGNYFSITTLTGQLNVWDTRTSTLVAQYIPSTHLSSGCTKISWAPDLINQHQQQQINGSTSSDKSLLELNKLQLLSMGTENGAIYLFSVHRNEIYSVLDCASGASKNATSSSSETRGHAARVNDICWTICSQNTTTNKSSPLSLFSCSDDDYIIEWNVLEGKIKSKTILDHSATITAICALDEQNLLTGSNLLKWWNWSRRQLLKTFNGHSNDIQNIRPLRFYNNDNQHWEAYCFTSAVYDRYVYLWKLDDYHKHLQTTNKSHSTPTKSTSSSNSVTSYLLDEEPISIEVSYTNAVDPYFLMSVSRSGYFYLFKDCLDDLGIRLLSTPTPMAPKFRLEIQSRIIIEDPHNSTMVNGGGGKKRKPPLQTIPCLYGHMQNQMNDKNHSINDDSNIKISLIYGLMQRPTFEQITIGECQKLCQNRNNHSVLIKDAQMFSNSGDKKGSTSLMDLLPRPSLIDGSNNMNNTMKIKSAIQPSTSSKKSEHLKTTVIGPAGMVPHQPLFNNINNNGIDDDGSDIEDDILNNNKKQKIDNKSKTKTTTTTESTNEEEMSIEERLRLLSKNDAIVVNRKHVTFVPSSNLSKRHWKETTTDSSDSKSNAAESLVNVLVQGLQSKDERMLRTVLLGEHSEQVIINTVKRLPVEHVPRLLVELEKGLCSGGKHQDHWLYLKWMTWLVSNKISYLMTIPNISDEFLPLKQLLQARTAMLEKCYQLKGRLDLILSQTKNELSTEKLTLQEPKLTYESDSSSEEEEDDDDDLDDEENDQMSIDDHDLMEQDGQDDNEGDDDDLSDSDIDEDDSNDDDPEDDDDDEELKTLNDKKQRSKRRRPRLEAEENDDDDDDD